jgi:hypothetical protein
MTEPLLAFVLIGCCVLVACGIATIPRKLRDLLNAVHRSPAREAQVKAEALADLFRSEISATKRGDLMAAAFCAAEQERAA